MTSLTEKMETLRNKLFICQNGNYSEQSRIVRVVGWSNKATKRHFVTVEDINNPAVQYYRSQSHTDTNMTTAMKERRVPGSQKLSLNWYPTQVPYLSYGNPQSRFYELYEPMGIRETEDAESSESFGDMAAIIEQVLAEDNDEPQTILF